MIETDPRWDLTEVRTMSGHVIATHRECNHLTPQRVESAGETVAWFCPDCDQQFPPERFA